MSLSCPVTKRRVFSMWLHRNKARLVAANTCFYMSSHNTAAEAALYQHEKIRGLIMADISDSHIRTSIGVTNNINHGSVPFHGASLHNTRDLWRSLMLSATPALLAVTCQNVCCEKSLCCAHDGQRGAPHSLLFRVCLTGCTSSAQHCSHWQTQFYKNKTKC